MKTIAKISTRELLAQDDDHGFIACIACQGDHVIAVGGAGNPTILESHDGGASFARRPHPVISGLRWIALGDGALHLVGEYGLIAVSVDAGLTWTRIPTDTEECMKQIGRAADGSWWATADGGIVYRSRDGAAYERAACIERTLSQDEDGDSQVRGFVIDVAGDVVALALGGEHALCGLAATAAGTLVVCGDRGQMYRSTDRGASWQRIAVPTREDIEAILATPRGVFAVGNEATLLYSDDDGASFVRVPNQMTGHLWALAARGESIVVGGDEGALWELSISDRATMQAETELPAELEDEEEDDEEDEDDDGAPAKATFASLEEASERWRREGTAFISGLNAYVRRCYDVGPNKAGHEPEETRQDMADYVRERLVELNAKGEHRRARELFPPAYEPFDYDGLGQSIDDIALLGDRLVVRTAGQVYELERDRISPQPDVPLFARSPDRRWIAKATSTGLDIHDGWTGPRVRTLPHVLPSVESAVVAPDGAAVLVASNQGILWLTEHGVRRLDGDDSPVDYAHAALSPNGRFVAYGTKDTAHTLIDRKTGQRRSYEAVSSYPCFTAFHRERAEVLFSSCHALYGSGTLAVSLDAVLAEKTAQARPIEQRTWVCAVAPLPNGWVLAGQGGYLWGIDFDGKQLWYLFLGSTITALDIAPDGSRMVVGSYAGYVVELALRTSEPDPSLLTDAPVRETARWVFWRDHPPLIW